MHNQEGSWGMSERWTIPTRDGSFSAYVAMPEGQGPRPAVVVIQEIFGVNAVMRETCDQIARFGDYVAICPDLFWRIEPGIDITDRTQAEWDLAMGYLGRFDTDKGVEDIRATIDFVRDRPECDGKVGDVGYCLGGKLAFLTAARTDADASVSYYGIGLQELVGEAEKLAHPLMMHIAEEDAYFPKAAQAVVIGALKDHPQVTIHTYPGRDHAFARQGGAHFDQRDAGLANERTLAFFKRHLG
jgi:carboxymethylenebutenolidase